MAFEVGSGAVNGRSGEDLGEVTGSPSIDPWAIGIADRCATHQRQFPEINCIRPLLAADVLAAAAQRATKFCVGADRVLVASGALSEETYLRALADTLGTEFEPLDDILRAQCPISDERMIECVAAGLLPITTDDDLCVVVSPRGTAARQILRLIEENPFRAQRFRFTSAERLNRFAIRYGGQSLAARASNQIRQTWPTLSAAHPKSFGNIAPFAVLVLLLLTAAALAPGATLFACNAMLGAVFLAWFGLRLIGALYSSPKPKPTRSFTHDPLPVYTIIAALYREAASVDGLLSAIEQLDYPVENLDVIIAVEADDLDTRSTIAVRKNRVPVAVIPVPPSGPRTKPKALNVALPFARGTFTVIYDAEDRPEPNQLRRALQAFQAGGKKLACVQARLCIDNTSDSWLTRLYTAEYAGQFDVFLPGLATLRLPLPLGGSSNHFNTATLRKVGGWDPYNVTEDADLGMRLARFGYRSDMIETTTYEEAPAHIGPWLRQRTRWFKGWTQTWLVHMRRPCRLFRELGWPGFLTFQLIVGGNVLAALVHPLFMGGIICSFVGRVPIWQGDSIVTVYIATIVVGYLASAFLGWLGLSRRGLLSTAWVLLWMPAYWLLLSLAAWRALYQLITAPYHWEKTEHGRAKSSRLAANTTRSLLQLERHLRDLKESGDLPPLAREVINSAEVRQPPPRVVA